MNKNEIITAECIDITGEGMGVCRHEGMVVFVPLAAIGDVLSIKIIKVTKNYCYGKIEEILTASSSRIRNDCPVFGQCGGCDFRHFKYKAELRVKHSIVKNNMVKFSGQEIEVLPVVASPDTAFYRNKAQYPVTMDKEGRVTFGFYAKRTHRVIPYMHCKLQPEIFSRILSKLMFTVNRFRITAYNETDGTGMLRHVYLRTVKSGDIMLCLVINQDELPLEHRIIDEMVSSFPQITSVVINVNKNKDNVILTENMRVAWGEDYLTEEILGKQYKISPLSFLQINRKSTENLYTIAAEYADVKPGETVIDLYSGVGTIGMSLYKDGVKLKGVEISSDATKNATDNAELNGIIGAEFICADADNGMKEILSAINTADVVILDPPRKGCTPEVIQMVTKLVPSRILMISCNSATCARDIKLFAELGYTTNSVQPLDMFPRTSHVECVTLMTKV